MLTKKTNNKPWIRPLPERVVNKIAAGEVVERPAAVVKELVENAVDAGATKIDIIIEKSGAKSIKIVDNGCGIPEEQIEIAFSRHATSKISSFDDLNALYTYGFRGEALPSIASVSRLRMVSRTSDETSGTEIIYEGGVLLSKKPIAAPPGTTVEVENLFFNTPARRKFLKSEATEARHVSRTAMALAIGNSGVGFTFIMNNRKIFSFSSDLSLADRVATVLGKDRAFIEFDKQVGEIVVRGCIGLPEMAQHNRYGQFIFINDRYIQSPVLSHAFQAGYGELLPKGMFPVGALLLDVPPEEVDVNVHPCKTEVRLSKEREIHDIVYHLVKEALQQDGIIPSFSVSSQKESSSGSLFTQQENASTPEAKQFVIPGVHQREKINIDSLSELYRPPANTPPSDLSYETITINRETGEVVDQITVDTGSDETAGPSEGFRYLGQFNNLYLLLQAGDDLYIVDQHTAHERVLFEELLKKLAEQSIHGQNLLFPVQVELTPEQLALFDEYEQVFNQSGFTVSQFGGRTVNIEAVPTVLAKKSPQTVFMNILDDLASLRETGYDMSKAMAQTMACRSAVMEGDSLSDREATHLLKALLQCKNRYSCPHGRPTFIKMTKAELDKQFGRG